jgi:FAD:protein FMN transferase
LSYIGRGEPNQINMMKKFGIAAILIVFLAGAGYLFYSKRAQNLPMQKRTRFLLDTSCMIQAPGGPDILPVIDKAFDRVEQVNVKFNSLDPKSPVYEFNHKGTPLADPEIVSVVEKALLISSQTGGAFDITVYPVVELWGFHRPLSEPHNVPSEAAIKQALGKVGYKQIAVRDGVVTKASKDVMIDLGAIAKGYAVLEAVKVLKENGVKSALVDFGGNIYTIGRLKGRPWRIAVKNPFAEGVAGVVEISDRGISTSGNYERFFEKDGVRYCHIMDPKTGRPARGLASVTVVYPDNTIPDAWSTSLFVLGKDASAKLPEASTYGEAIFITEKGEISYTLGLENKFKILDKFKAK